MVSVPESPSRLQSSLLSAFVGKFVGVCCTLLGEREKAALVRRVVSRTYLVSLVDENKVVEPWDAGYRVSYMYYED